MYIAYFCFKKSKKGFIMLNALTVDVEDYFQVSAFERYISRDDWDGLPRRVEVNTDRILALFDRFTVKATFFTLGWVAKRHPNLVRRIVENGHEIACHGYSHVRVTQQTPKEFSKDVYKAKILIEDIAGVRMRGYRAASYSIGADNLWALEILEELGFDYSSSIYPIHHDHYGMPEAPRFAFRPDRTTHLLEIPVTTVAIGNKNIPCGGGGFFRLIPYPFTQWALNRVNNRDQQSCVFYFHPWEIDADQPKQSGIDIKTRIRHYVNLARMETKLVRLLNDFSWGSMEAVFFPKPI
jgi:polysaccharide deacetylase family protein (PEP-CTERM system associated)